LPENFSLVKVIIKTNSLLIARLSSVLRSFLTYRILQMPLVNSVTDVFCRQSTRVVKSSIWPSPINAPTTDH